MAGNKNSGRKCLLNDDLIDTAVELLKAGNYAVVVCQYLGISEVTYYSYVKQGEADIEEDKETIYSKFVKSIKEAEAQAEMRNVTNIQRASLDSWQASAWYLERKHKQRWAQQQRVELTGKNGGPIETESAKERLKRKLNSMAERSGEE